MTTTQAADGNKPIVPVRFPPSLAAAAASLAEQDGMSVSAWIRGLAVREIGRREGKCPACGQPAGRPAPEDDG